MVSEIQERSEQPRQATVMVLAHVATATEVLDRVSLEVSDRFVEVVGNQHQLQVCSVDRAFHSHAVQEFDQRLPVARYFRSSTLQTKK